MHDGGSAISVRNRGAVGGVTKIIDRCRYAVTAAPHDSTARWSGRRDTSLCHAPSEPGERVAPHPAQATGREFKVSDGTPADWCSRVTFTLAGIQLFPWMSPLLPILSTRHPATSAPFQVGYHPIRRAMNSPCLSAAGVRLLAVLSP
jgi:hypothetical protein